MIHHDDYLEATQRELEAAYERALRYALRYRTRWDRVDEAAEKLRAFMREQERVTATAA